MLSGLVSGPTLNKLSNTAKLSSSFNFSRADMVFNHDLPQPSIHPTIQESIKTAKYKCEWQSAKKSRLQKGKNTERQNTIDKGQ